MYDRKRKGCLQHCCIDALSAWHYNLSIICYFQFHSCCRQSCFPQFTSSGKSTRQICFHSSRNLGGLLYRVMGAMIAWGIAQSTVHIPSSAAHYLALSTLHLFRYIINWTVLLLCYHWCEYHVNVPVDSTTFCGLYIDHLHKILSVCIVSCYYSTVS